MPARVLFFGATADIAGHREIEISVSDDLTAEAALKEIVRKLPGLGSHKLLIAINQQYAAQDEIVRDGDELAIFTAVSGG